MSETTTIMERVLPFSTEAAIRLRWNAEQMSHESKGALELMLKQPQAEKVRPQLSYDFEVGRDYALHALTLCSLAPGTARDYYYPISDFLTETLRVERKKHPDLEIVNFDWIVPCASREEYRYQAALYTSILDHLDRSLPK